MIIPENKGHEFFMRAALKEAKKALITDDVPIGAVIVKETEIIGRGHNSVEATRNPMDHAEIIAIREAVVRTGYKYLAGCSIYITLEPCSMCSGAIVLARIDDLIFGAEDPKAGASGSLFTITEDQRINHRCNVTKGILKEECSKLLKDFFQKLRKK